METLDQSSLEHVRLIILSVGWPALIVGTIVIMYKTYDYYKQMDKSPVARPVLVFALANIITMFGLGIVSTAFMYHEDYHGVVIVLPVFMIWASLMIYIMYQAFVLDEEAIKYRDEIENFLQAKDDFVSMSSHQLRSPLTGMNWTLDLLLNNKSMDAKAKEQISSMKSSVQSLLALIANLLSVTRIESGRVEMKKENINFEATIEEVIKILKPNIDRKNINININNKSKIKNINTDKVLLSEIIKNLFSNSIEYVPEHGHIWLELSRYSKKILEFKVYNDGPIIKKERQKTIFEKFSRERAVTHDIVQNIGGLGLYITKEFVERLGGKIRVESEEGGHTTFIFTIKE